MTGSEQSALQATAAAETAAHLDNVTRLAPQTMGAKTMPAIGGPHKIYWSCERKHRYPNRRSAQTASMRVLDRLGLMNVYECPYCSGWHLGHSKDVSRETSDALDDIVCDTARR